MKYYVLLMSVLTVAMPAFVALALFIFSYSWVVPAGGLMWWVLIMGAVYTGFFAYEGIDRVVDAVMDIRKDAKEKRDNTDEGPFDNVGWGPFALPGERKRLREQEAARVAEVNAMGDK